MSYRVTNRTLSAFLFLASLAVAAPRLAHADDGECTLLAQADEDLGSSSLEEKLFTPDLIMSHQKELGIEEKQRTAIINEITKAQNDILQGRWQLKGATEQLAALLEASPIEESKTLAQAEKVMNLERDVKKANLAMLIRIKNQLTAAQQKKLAKLRDDGDDEDDSPMRPGFQHRLQMKIDRAMKMHHGDDHQDGDDSDDETPPSPPSPPRPPTK